VRALTAATERLATGDFAARVVGSTEDELQDLVVSFNRMAGDLLRQRQDLERTNRLAAWAEMARQVAHEVKNPLTPIQLSAEHLRRVYANKNADFAQTLETCTETILRQVRTLRGIVTEFSSFARPPAPVLERVELAPLTEGVVRQYAPALPDDVSLEVASAEPLSVMADARLIERAVVNLVENALQAVGDRGHVLVRVLGDGNGRAVIEVQDDGPGLDAEAQRKAFEPFFSTKSGGSGLGLALVKKIAEDHEGGVSLESVPGAPTRARLWLPVVAATTDAPASGETPAE
jgi:nitrogen fixation/metabolism regulation signal transduction histidine kinase